MRLALLSSCLLFAVAACSKSSATLTGTYDLDTAAFSASMLAEAKKKPEYNEAQMKPVAEMMAKQMKGSMELKADGSAVMHMGMGKADETGTWKADGDKITVTSKKGDKDEVHDGKIEGDLIRFVENQNGMPMPLTFKKQK